MSATLTAPTASRVFLGRQPIFDRRRNVSAYELLYRTGEANAAHVFDGELATSTVINNALCEFGLDAIAGEKDILINMPPASLESGLPEILPSDRCIVEVLEDVEPDEATLESFRRLKAAGCRLALDDVVFEPRLAPLLELADLIKVDLVLTPADQLAEHVRQMRRVAPSAPLLAEKVETADEYDRCRELGFDLFQGYFFCRPQIIEGRRLTADRSRTLQLLARLQDEELPLQEAADLIAGDPALSVKLLNFINSAAVGLTRQVESIKRAAALVGRTKLRVWATLIGLSGMSNKPRELMLTANVRGRMCELIGERIFGDESGAFFTLGMFSLLDAFTDTSLEDLLATLPLPQPLIDGLLHGAGDFGQTLSAVRLWEAGRFDQAPACGVECEVLQSCYADAVRWADETVSGLAA